MECQFIQQSLIFFYFGQDDKEKEVIFPIICVDQFYLRL